MFDYDVAYLGSGHFCWHGALTMAAAEKKVSNTSKSLRLLPSERWKDQSVS